MKTIREELFSGIDFGSLVSNEDFKEDSVRETIILPILKRLGYTDENIVRSKKLEHPILKLGSNKKIPITLIPDYLLRSDVGYLFVLDAKSPRNKITDSENVEQVYSYAMHPEVYCSFFALCNGISFSLYRTSDPREPLLFFDLSDIDDH